MMENKPILAIISDDIRRDLHAPLQHFNKIKIAHFYRLARYNDMKKEDFIGTISYNNYQDLYKKLVELGPNIIQGPEPFASRAALLNCWTVYNYARRFKKPYFFPMFKNRPAEIKFGWFVGKLMKFILKKYADSARMVINLNKGARKTLLEIGVEESKIKHLNWGTWGVTPEFKPNSKIKTKSAKAGKPIMLFVGKVEAQKGIPELTEAFKIVKDKYPASQLWVIGAGRLAEGIKTIEGVRYFGTIKNQNLPIYFQQAWLTVAPSVTTRIWEEQVGMVNIQSMACGTPVVSTLSGAIPEYVPNKLAGILVPEHASDELAEAMIKIISDARLRKKMGDFAAKYVLKTHRDRDNILRAEEMVLDLIKNG